MSIHPVAAQPEEVPHDADGKAVFEPVSANTSNPFHDLDILPIDKDNTLDENGAYTHVHRAHGVTHMQLLITHPQCVGLKVMIGNPMHVLYLL